MPLLRHLRYFIAVAEERHFGRAARRLMIAQPGLSQQIKELERTIGTALLVRDRRGVDLTPAGEALLDHARLVVELADRAVENTRAVAEGKAGVLRVGTRALGVQPEIDRLIREFQAAFPHVGVEVYPVLGTQSITDLERRKVDVATVPSLMDAPEGARYLSLGCVQPLAAVPLGHRLAASERITREQLLRETFVVWPRSFNPRMTDVLIEKLFGTEQPRRLVVVADLADATRLARVAAGEGVTVTFSAVYEHLPIANVVLKPIDVPGIELEYGIAWYENSLSPFVDPFVALAHEIASAHAGRPLVAPESATAGSPEREM